MGPTDIAIIAAVLVLFVVAAIRMVGTATGKRDCCSGAAKQDGASCGKKFAPVRIEDTDPAHYPYTAELGIGGMSCAHCVASVEQAGYRLVSFDLRNQPV